MEDLARSLQLAYEYVKGVAREANLARYEEMTLIVDELCTFPNKPQEGHAGVIRWLDQYNNLMTRAQIAVNFVTDSSWVDIINTKMSGTHVSEVKYHMQKLKHDLGKVKLPDYEIPKEKFEHMDQICSDKSIEYAAQFVTTEQLRELVLSRYMTESPLPKHPIQRMSLIFGRTPENKSAMDGAEVYDASISCSTPTVYDIDSLLMSAREVTTYGLSHPIVKRLNTIRKRSEGGQDAKIYPVVQKDGYAMTPVICPIPLDDMLRGPSRQIPAYHDLTSSSILDPQPLNIVVSETNTEGDTLQSIINRHKKWEHNFIMYRDYKKETLSGAYDSAMREFGLSALLQLEELDKKLLPSHMSVKLQLINHGACC